MWKIKRSWTDDTKLSYEEEVMLSNILCQHCAGKRTLKDAEAIATDIVQDIYLKIGEVSGSGVLPIPASPTLQLFIYGGYCSVKAHDRPIKIIVKNQKEKELPLDIQDKSIHR